MLKKIANSFVKEMKENGEGIMRLLRDPDRMVRTGAGLTAIVTGMAGVLGAGYAFTTDDSDSEMAVYAVGGALAACGVLAGFTAAASTLVRKSDERKALLEFKQRQKNKSATQQMGGFDVFARKPYNLK